MITKAVSRLTVLLTVRHAQPERQPKGVEVRYSMSLTSPDQLYQREMVAGPEWTPLGRGWIKGTASLVVIANDEGKGYRRIPTPAELEDTMHRVIEIAVGNGEPVEVCDLVPPGQAVAKIPPELGAVWVRCRHATAAFTLTIVPS